MHLADHLAKGRESRTFGPGGSMAKRRTVGGSSIRVVRVRPFTRRDGGEARLWVNKDRHGGLRDHCSPPLPGKEEQLAGTFVLGAADADGRAAWRVVADSGVAQEFRPTYLMERVSRVIEDHPDEFTRDRVAKEAGGRKEHTLLGIDILEREGYVVRSQDRYPRYTSVKQYRQADDPRSDQGMDLGDRLRQHLRDDDGAGEDADE